MSNNSSQYVKKLESLANESVWLPAKINEDGTIENAWQAYVKVSGAEKGEGNFKKMQRPTKHGYKDHCDLGTYVMNMHVKYEPVQAQVGEKANALVDGARLVRLGQYVKRSKLNPQDRIFAEAARNAARILEEKAKEKKNNSTAQSNSAEAESERIFVA